jgi:hypothetical protein
MRMMHKIVHADSGLDPNRWFEKAAPGERVRRNVRPSRHRAKKWPPGDQEELLLTQRGE